MKTWWRSVRTAVTAGHMQRGVLYVLAGVTLVFAVLVSAFPQWGNAAAIAAGRFITQDWPSLLLVIVAVLLAAVARTGGRRVNARRRRLPPLVPLLVHVALLLSLAVVVAAGTGALLWTAVGRPSLTGTPDAATVTPVTTPIPGQPSAPRVSPQWTLTNTFDAMKIVLSVVAGIGGVVALTVAYRRQHLGEAAEQREDTKLFSDRFSKAAELIGSGEAAVRLAGVYAVAALADDWTVGRQTCIDVLCAYLRMPYTAPGDEAADEAPPASRPRTRRPPLRSQLYMRPRAATGLAASPAAPTSTNPDQARREERQVRHTVIRLIRDHLRLPAENPHSWQGNNLDFTGAVFDGGDFSQVHFAGGVASFAKAVFCQGAVSFAKAVFSAGEVTFEQARFSGSEVSFDEAVFSGAEVAFEGAKFCGSEVSFQKAAFLDGLIGFGRARFSDGEVNFTDAAFSGGEVFFGQMLVTGGDVIFLDVLLLDGCKVSFPFTSFSGGRVSFQGAQFRAPVSFERIRLRGGLVDFKHAEGPVRRTFSFRNPPDGLLLPDRWLPPLVTPPSAPTT